MLDRTRPGNILAVTSTENMNMKLAIGIVVLLVSLQVRTGNIERVEDSSLRRVLFLSHKFFGALLTDQV